MTDIFLESMEYEQNQLLDKFTVEIEEARLALLECVDPSPLFEAGSDEEQKSGGIFQAILGVLKAIIRAIGRGLQKVANWMTGAKVTPEGETAKIQGIDPNIAVKLVNGDLADASDALKKAASGEMSIEEAKAFIDKKESVWKTVRNSALPVAGLAAFFLAKKFTADKWIAEANAAKDNLEKLNREDNPNGSDSKLASNVAHQFGDRAKRDAAKQASNLIVNHMQETTRRGLDIILGPIREAFQKGYLSRQLMKEAELMGTKEGRQELAERDKKRLKATQAEAKQTRRLGKNLNKASKQGNRNIDKQMHAENQLEAERMRTYDNVKNTITPDQLDPSRSKTTTTRLPAMKWPFGTKKK